ncbi:MAG TPA: CpsD/CapB family tyrosine-protein kinase [Candidatus Faecousia faecavium]|nr:CpsD/CapB family tyrosine-protein kinase [Candidatus Faecousia faecavium]
MKKKAVNADNLSLEESRKTLGENLSFGAAEAYKLLRTNLGFSLSDSTGCKVIGVTSAMKGEGKSTTSINMAYTMAQSGGRVLLMEADLRLPTVAKRLGLKQKPGITNLLVGQVSGNEILQRTNLISNLWVASAGDIPPNPAELLGSANMKTTIQTMSEAFDVIIVDLPPITAVTDAVLVSKIVDGMVVVVRQNYCDRDSLEEVVRQLRFANAKILGFVMTGADVQRKNYRRYGKSYGDYRQPGKGAGP